MLIEKDRVEWTAGLRYGRTLGSPLAFGIENRDWENWQDRMSVEPKPPSKRPKPITLARPGHADLAGMMKFGTKDAREVLERSSARETVVRVAAGAVASQLLAEFGVRVHGFLVSLGDIDVTAIPEDPDDVVAARDASEFYCPDTGADDAMKE